VSVHRFLTTDVFTDRIFGGNPLAVFPDATGIPESALQPLAREFNLSETVFVYPPADPQHTRRLRIFTPTSEIPFAGHPTVGTAFVLASLGDILLAGAETRIIFEEGVGPVPVMIRSQDGAPTFAQLTAAKAPEIGPPPPSRSTIAEMLSLELSDLGGGTWAPQPVSCGLPFLIVPLKDRDAVARARLRMDLWESSLRAYWAPDVLIFARDVQKNGSAIRARMFGPVHGIVEDPATGSAATALGAYLAHREPPGSEHLRYVMEQGFEMGRPSILEIEVDRHDHDIAAIRVGGRAVMVAEGRMRSNA
jgi:trans-2,3-dihydro-3-hydroxyanthranilate isomerase